MTTLERALDLLNRYDKLAEAGVKSHPMSSFGQVLLEELREEKEKLTEELVSNKKN